MQNRCLYRSVRFRRPLFGLASVYKCLPHPLPSLGEGCDGKAIPLSNPFRAAPVDEVRHKSQAPSGVTLRRAVKPDVRVLFPLSISRRLMFASGK